MTLPRKGTRRIVIDGVAYRWHSSIDSLAVQHETVSGALLLIRMERTWPRAAPHPAEVAEWIRQGLRAGWNATEKGPPFTLLAQLTPDPPRISTEPARLGLRTEAEWRASTDPLRMLAGLDLRPDDRKVCLLLGAVCDLVRDQLPLTGRDRVLSLAARADDPDADRSEVYSALWCAGWNRDLLALAATCPSGSIRRLLLVVRDVIALSWWHAVPGDNAPESEPERARVAHLVREVFGNPFAKPIVRRSGLNRTIRAIAEIIYTESRFEDLPILADALEESDCADAAILEHLRTPGSHVRGCQALDLVLGKDAE